MSLPAGRIQPAPRTGTFLRTSGDEKRKGTFLEKYIPSVRAFETCRVLRNVPFLRRAYAQSADHRHHRPGRLAPPRVPPRQRNEVHGIIRRASTFNTGRIDHVYVDPHVAGARLFLHYGDLADSGQMTNLIYNLHPDEIYHLGAQSHVRVSFDIPEYTGDVTGLGTTRILEALRRANGKARYYQASSSEMFGASSPPQSDKTPFYPLSPYGAAKVYSYWMAVNYREAYGMFASNGILFNHESPR